MKGTDEFLERYTGGRSAGMPPRRAQILCRLLDGERSVGELAQACGMSQSSMSQQLKRLKEAGLIEGRRDRQTIYYSVKGREVAAVLETLHGLYCTR